MSYHTNGDFKGNIVLDRAALVVLHAQLGAFLGTKAEPEAPPSWTGSLLTDD